MKKILSLLLVATCLVNKVHAGSMDEEIFYDALDTQLVDSADDGEIFYDAPDIGVNLIMADGSQEVQFYSKDQLQKLTLFQHLFEDIDSDDQLIDFNIKESRPSHFAELVALANGQQTALSDTFLQDARNNPDYLKQLFLLAMHVDPINKKALNPITLDILNNPSILINKAGEVDNNDLVFALLDNFVELINQPVKHIFRVQEYTRTLLATDYLKNALNNRQARLLISGIKKQAFALYKNEKLYQRINMYLYDKPLNTYKDLERLFPAVPGTLLGSRPKPGPFPISTKDIVDLMGVTLSEYDDDGDDNNNMQDDNQNQLRNKSKTLDLSANRITSIDPETFKNMPAFNWLNLTGNKISSVQADDFTHLGNITVLTLDSNKLTELPADVFSKMPLLEDLFLHNNKLVTIQPGVFNNLTRLIVVNVSDNLLTTVPSGLFTNLPRLEDINLSNNQIASFDNETFTNLPSLQTLNLINNPLQETKEEIRAANPALPNNCAIYLKIEDVPQ